MLLDREISSDELNGRLTKTDVSGIIYDSEVSDTVRKAGLCGEISRIPMEKQTADEEENNDGLSFYVSSRHISEIQKGMDKRKTGHSGDSLACIGRQINAFAAPIFVVFVGENGQLFPFSSVVDFEEASIDAVVGCRSVFHKPAFIFFQSSS